MADHKHNENGLEGTLRNKNPYFKHATTRSYERIDEILKYMRDGWSRTRIFDKFMKEWNVGERQIYIYYHDALLRIANKYEDTSEDVKNIQLERIEKILADCLAAKDRKTALNAIDMINRLHSLYVDKKEIKADVSEWKFDYNNA